MARDRPARGRARAWSLIALVMPHAAAAAATMTMAEPPALESAPGETRAPLELYVNVGRRQAIQVVLRDGDALVRVEDLDAAGLRGFAGRRESIDGHLHVSLASLGPDVRYEIDEKGLALRVTAGPDQMGRSSIDLRGTRRPPGLEVGGDASGFLDYSLQTRTDRRTSGFAEAGASQGGRLLYSSGQILADGTAVRGLSNLTVDDAGSLRRLVLGDGFASSSALGGGVLLGGVTLAREYGLDPYFIRSPMPRLSGFASTPSTLDVYVNGVLMRQVPLAPGGYDISNLPVTTGAGNVQTVLRDAFGRTEVLNWQYYYTAAIHAELRPRPRVGGAGPHPLPGREGMSRRARLRGTVLRVQRPPQGSPLSLVVAAAGEAVSPAHPMDAPVATNDTPAGRRANRRVDVEILPSR